MSTFPFTKMHGLGNDFVMVDCLQGSPIPEERLSALSQAACTHHFGVGADGLILILPDDEADYRMRMFNPDGSESEMCGNGIRCFAKYLYDADLIKSDSISVATQMGLQHIEIPEQDENSDVLKVRVDMGKPRLARDEIPMRELANGQQSNAQVVNEELQVDDQTHHITAVSMGNPHCVIFVDDVESVPLKEWGLKIEHHDMFPERTNVHFVQVLGPGKLWMRTWERGAGDTLACGSGACSVAVAAALNGKSPRIALVHLPGGDLEIEWAENDHVYMTGPAATVFSGELPLDFHLEN
jgi:diaminopimelate epimerase